MSADGAGDDPQGPANEAERFDSLRFARTYVVTFVMRVAGAIAFVGGCGLALLTRRGGGVFVVAGAVALMVGSAASSVSAYRVLSPVGYGWFAAWSRSRPWSSASLSRYRAYRELLRGER